MSSLSPYSSSALPVSNPASSIGPGPLLGHATTSINADTYRHVAQQAEVPGLNVIGGGLEIE